MSTEPDIVVTAYSPRFLAANARVLKREGGFVNHPADPGGATNKGISLRFLAAELKAHPELGDFDLDMDGDVDGQDIRLLDDAAATMLYHECFWRRLACDSFAAPIGEMLFDQAVNGGALAARKLLQRALNAVLARFAGYQGRPAPLTVDGAIGAATRGAIVWVLQLPGAGMNAIVVAYREAAIDRYRLLAARRPELRVFLDGWINRAKELGRL